MPKDPEIMTWRVLIVDDELDNIIVASKVLTLFGATVYTAANGLEGLAVLSQTLPSFVLVDLSMPTMDGWEMLREVRSNPAYNAMPMIAVTAHALATDRIRVLDAGFNAYIVKPFTMATLIDDIKTCLKNFGLSPT